MNSFRNAKVEGGSSEVQHLDAGNWHSSLLHVRFNLERVSNASFGQMTKRHADLARS